MPAKVYLNEVDLPLNGIYATVGQTWRDAPRREFPTAAIPGRHGVVVSGDPTVAGRTLSIPFVIQPAAGTIAARLNAERLLVSAASRGLVQITYDDDTNPPVAIDGHYVDAQVRLIGHEIQSIKSNATVSFFCPDPTWRDVAGQVIAFNATPRGVPVGTSPGDGIVRISAPSWSANVVNPKLWYYAASSAERASLTFTTTLTAGTHYIEVDLGRVTATLYASGAASNAVPLITAGDFFAIEPHDGDPITGSYPMLAVTADSGTPSGEWLGTRRWL